jgi:regulator of protease activity HflC (stomatin/prohibitin superfamily)
MAAAVVVVIIAIFMLAGIRKIPQGHVALVERLGRQLPGIRPAGYIYIIPTIDRTRLISIEPFQFSLPPQSGITSDEVPLQLQASLVARVQNPEQTTTVNDWRTSTVSTLQNLMKDELEELDFDRLQSEFPDWVCGLRKELERRVAVFGVEIHDLQISNLSPRTRP